MQYDPKIHHRRSIRLAGFDYSTPGPYFVTICTHNRHCLFGCINDGDMITNDAGPMISHWWTELGSKYARVQPDLHIIMPNHFHGIVIIEGDPIPDGPVPPAFNRMAVGAALRGRPTTSDAARAHAIIDEAAPEGAHAGAPLPDIIGWLKTITTNEYIRGVKERGWPRFDGHLWQRDYYERVIRSEDELLKVRQYVNNNPAKWEDDPNHPSKLKATTLR